MKAISGEHTTPPEYPLTVNPTHPHEIELLFDLPLNGPLLLCPGVKSPHIDFADR
jgi:hypothetical protein